MIGSVVGVISWINQWTALILLAAEDVINNPMHLEVQVASLETISHVGNGDTKQPSVLKENHSSPIRELQH